MSLTPLGTVRRRLGAPEPRSAPFPQWLVDAARERDLDETTVYLAWEIASVEDGVTSLEHEALMTLVVLTIIALRDGSTRLSREQLRQRFADFGADGEHYAAVTRLLENGSEILGGPRDYKPLVVSGDYIYHQRIYRQERGVAERMAERLRQAEKKHGIAQLMDALDDVLGRRIVVAGRRVQLSSRQQQAIRMAAMRPLTLLTGGPGTGKTLVVAVILQVLARLGVPSESIALAAPTGKAAKRLAETIRAVLRTKSKSDSADSSWLSSLAEPATLHRLLGYSRRTRRIRYAEQNQLPAQVIIVDDASMIGLDLMERLMRAAKPEAQLVLLGDVHQLPSVDAGAVFRDFARAGGNVATVELRGSYRIDTKDPSGRQLVEASEHVQAGNAAPLFESRAGDVMTIRESAREVRFRGCELLEGERDTFLERWRRERVMTPRFRELVEAEALDDDRLATVEAHLASHRILCVTHRDVAHVNGFMQRAQRLRLGEPVMMLRSDLERGLFNGDAGISLSSGIVFGGRRFDSRSVARNLATAYAVSVHKSQGSEYDHVALILPDAGHPLLTRELLYTAMTRARKSVTILGSLDALSGGISRTIERSTGILEHLA